MGGGIVVKSRIVQFVGGLTRVGLGDVYGWVDVYGVYNVQVWYRWLWVGRWVWYWCTHHVVCVSIPNHDSPPSPPVWHTGPTHQWSPHHPLCKTHLACVYMSRCIVMVCVYE